MKIIKRNQLIILVMSLMLITAGYLNFTTDNTNVQTSQVLAELGDATLVNSNVLINEDSKSNENEEVEENSNEEESEQEEVLTTAVVDDTYFVNSKLERENMYSQMLETYQQIYNNTDTNAEQKTSALHEIAGINNTKNSIMIAENLLLAKGFEQIVIFTSENSTSVIIGEQELNTEQIAQIQNIVSRELNVDAEKIHISKK